mgnify:CR=1 FL=1
MKICLLGFIFLSSLNLYAKPDFVLGKNQLESFDKNQLKELRVAYIDFLSSVEKDTEYEELKTSFLKFSLIKEANADFGGVCFFGGWPSLMEGGYCRSPWKTKNDSRVQSFGGYEASSACGSNTEFRCNPLLFGAPKEGSSSQINGVQINLNPKNGNASGYCVNTGGSYVELTNKCLRASKDNEQELIDKYKNDPDYQQKIADFSQAIDEFCSAKPSYDACDDLANRLGAIKSGTVTDAPLDPAIVDENPVEQEIIEGATSEQPFNPLLNKCQNYLNDKYGYSVLGNATCEQAVTSDEISSDLENVNVAMQRLSFAGELNSNAVEFMVMGLVANSKKFGLPLAGKDGFVEELLEKYPNLNNYKDKIELAYDNSSMISKSDIDNGLKVYRESSNGFSQLCKDLNKEYQALFTNTRRGRRAPKSKKNEVLNKYKDIYFPKLENLFQTSGFSSLFGTDHFKDEFFDLGEDHLAKCAQDADHEILKMPISSNDITKAAMEINEDLDIEIKEISSRQKNISSTSKSQDVIRDYLESDPALALYTLQQNPELSDIACQESIGLQSKKRITGYLTGAAYAVVGLGGAILTATGVGAPLGSAMISGALLATGIGTAVNQYSNAQRQEQLLSQALYLNQKSAQDAVKAQSQIDSEKSTAVVAGIADAALTVVPVVGALAKGVRATTQASRTANVISDAKTLPELARTKDFLMMRRPSSMPESEFKMLQGQLRMQTDEFFALQSRLKSGNLTEAQRNTILKQIDEYEEGIRKTQSRLNPSSEVGSQLATRNNPLARTDGIPTINADQFAREFYRSLRKPLGMSDNEFTSLVARHQNSAKKLIDTRKQLDNPNLSASARADLEKQLNAYKEELGLLNNKLFPREIDITPNGSVVAPNALPAPQKALPAPNETSIEYYRRLQSQNRLPSATNGQRAIELDRMTYRSIDETRFNNLVKKPASMSDKRFQEIKNNLITKQSYIPQIQARLEGASPAQALQLRRQLDRLRKQFNDLVDELGAGGSIQKIDAPLYTR